MQIIIAPSFGSAAARRHWADTLDTKVDFASQRALLSPSEQSALDRLHPDGMAHFWGGVATQDRNVSRMQEGDFVLFTGQNMVRGIGEVGARFQNAAFADTMWPRTPIAAPGTTSTPCSPSPLSRSPTTYCARPWVPAPRTTSWA